MIHVLLSSMICDCMRVRTCIAVHWCVRVVRVCWCVHACVWACVHSCVRTYIAVRTYVGTIKTKDGYENSIDCVE